MPVPLNSYGDFLWGRLVTCGRLVIGPTIFLVQNEADYQSAAGYQPALHGLLRAVAFLVLLSAAARTRIVTARLFLGNGLFFLDRPASTAAAFPRGHFPFSFALNIAREAFDGVLGSPSLTS